MNLFDWVVIGLLGVGIIGFLWLWLLAKGMSDKVD
jgi:hypothetical protein